MEDRIRKIKNYENWSVLLFSLLVLMWVNYSMRISIEFGLFVTISCIILLIICLFISSIVNEMVYIFSESCNQYREKGDNCHKE